MRYLHTMDSRQVNELLAEYTPEEPTMRVVFFRRELDANPRKVVLYVTTDDIREAYQCAVQNGHDPYKYIMIQRV